MHMAREIDDMGVLMCIDVFCELRERSPSEITIIRVIGHKP